MFESPLADIGDALKRGSGSCDEATPWSSAGHKGVQRVDVDVAVGAPEREQPVEARLFEMRELDEAPLQMTADKADHTLESFWASK